MATTNAIGELLLVKDAMDASAPVLDCEPAGLAVDALGEPVAVAVACPVLALVVEGDDPELNFSGTVLAHWPLRPTKDEASLTAAGVEPQFSYCCR